MASADVALAGSPAGSLAPDDLSRISSVYSLQQSSLDELLQSANSFVPDLYRAMLAKAAEFDELRGAKLRVDVELEQAVRTADTRVRSMKAQLDSSLQETQVLRTKSTETGL